MRTLALNLDLDLEARPVWHALATVVELMDAIEAEPGNAIPAHAPLYGQRDRLVDLAQRLDHEINQAGGPARGR